MDADKEDRADAKLLNLSQEELEFLWRLRYPEKGGKKMKMEAICVEIPLRYGFTVSISTLSYFYKKLRRRRRIEAAAAVADQFKAELAKDPTISEEDLDAMATKVFKTELFEDNNAAGYLAVAKFQLQKQKHLLAMEKLAASAKSKREAGLEALLEEIQGNLRAIEIFNQLREVLDEAEV